MNTLDSLFIQAYNILNDSISYPLESALQLLLVYQGIRKGCLIRAAFLNLKNGSIRSTLQMSKHLIMVISLFQLQYIKKDHLFFISLKKSNLQLDSDFQIGQFLGYPSLMDQNFPDKFQYDIYYPFTANVFVLIDFNQQLIYLELFTFVIKQSDLVKATRFLQSFQQKFIQINQCSFFKQLHFVVTDNFDTRVLQHLF